MQLLHLLRELGPEARQEVQDFVEFKVRRIRSERRATGGRKTSESSS
jgi:hypothetical protein